MSELFRSNDELDETLLPQRDQKNAFLYPIDEAEEFYDPFSDLNLFLSKKVKKEIQEAGSTAKWSGKIEANLLAKILPEFKKKFPKYRLGTRALKKVWEKVAYYYEKTQGHKGAFKDNGKLNLKFMIRENLKNTVAPYHLPPYTLAGQIALKLSECIATLEGEKPELDHLTKMIWAVQKHLLKDLSSVETKNPYEEYDKLDKFIVKALLETTAKGENLEPETLKRTILKELSAYAEIQTLVKNNTLTSTLSMLLAEKLMTTSHISCHFSIKERQTLETFIRHQIAISETSDHHPLELFQRILALYTIIRELPKNLNEDQLRFAIEQTQEENEQSLDPALFIFINAQKHLMAQEEIEPIFKAYTLGQELPFLSDVQMERLELIIWKMLAEQDHFFSEISPRIQRLLEKELGNVLIDNPKQSFRMIINTTLQCLKKTLDLFDNQDKLKGKIETWTLQNDMLLRNIHFDPKTPLLKLLETQWKEQKLDEKTVDHETFVADMETAVLKVYPLLSSFSEELQTRLWILYKYFWYTYLSNGSDSTYERFLLWHQTLLKNRHSDWSKEKLRETLAKLSDQLIPLAPFEIAS